jgi:hypothetical protein
VSPGQARERRSLKYIRLAAHFAALPPEDDSVVLKLADIEDLIGEPLPRSARFPSWWKNDPHKMHARAWLTAGWYALEMDAEALTVVFHRSSGDIDP